MEEVSPIVSVPKQERTEKVLAPNDRTRGGLTMRRGEGQNSQSQNLNFKLRK